MSVKVKDSNYGMSVPGNIAAYLQVVDLMANRLRYIPASTIQNESLQLLDECWFFDRNNTS